MGLGQVGEAGDGGAGVEDGARADVGLPLLELGLAGGDTIEFEGQLKVSLAELRQAWEVMVT